MRAAAVGELVVRASDALAEARTGLEEYSGLADRAAGMLADQHRAGIKAPLPAGVLEARRVQFDRQQDVADAKAALSLLSGEHTAALAEAAASAVELSLACDRAMTAKALALLEQARTVEAELSRLRTLVAAFPMSRPTNATPRPWEITQLHYDPIHPFLVEPMGPR